MINNIPSPFDHEQMVDELKAYASQEAHTYEGQIGGKG
jgi:hypothetical protein